MLVVECRPKERERKKVALYSRTHGQIDKRGTNRVRAVSKKTEMEREV
jgi:hypothetical protein